MKHITSKEQSKEVAIFLLNKRYGDLKEYSIKKYPRTIFYSRPTDKKIIMEQDLKNKILYIRYDEIWLFLEMLFHYDYYEIQDVIKIWVKEFYNLKGVIPHTFR